MSFSGAAGGETGHELTDSLARLEQKLRVLEEELLSGGAGAAAGTAQAPGAHEQAEPPASPQPPPAGPAAGSVAPEELLRFRERLERTTRELLDDYNALLARLGVS